MGEAPEWLERVLAVVLGTGLVVLLMRELHGNKVAAANGASADRSLKTWLAERPSLAMGAGWGLMLWLVIDLGPRLYWASRGEGLDLAPGLVAAPLYLLGGGLFGLVISLARREGR